MIDSFELSPKRYLLTIIGQHQSSKQPFVAGQVGHVKTIPFRSMNIIAGRLVSGQEAAVEPKTSMFNFLGAVAVIKESWRVSGNWWNLSVEDHGIRRVE